MKKLFFALLLAAVALTGCDKDETTDVVLHDVELKASIDLNASRVAFDQGGNFFWTVSDAIGVTTTANKSNFEKMTMKDGGAGQATATFKGSFMSGKPEGYAVYPYNREHTMNGSELTYNFPTSYNYTIEDHSYFVTDGQGNSFNPAMWATIEDGSVHFKHLGGVFCIAVADMPAGANQTLTVTTSKRITGNFTTDLAANPVLVTDNEAGNEVTINFSNAAESDRVFYVPVPTGLYEKICIAFEADGELVEVYFENKRVNARSLKIMRIGEFELEGGEADLAKQAEEALRAAIAKGGSYTLTSDVVLTSPLVVATDFELDLNGHTISHENECSDTYAMITNKSNLTITGNGAISFEDLGAGPAGTDWGTYLIYNEGELTISLGEDGKLEHKGPRQFTSGNGDPIAYVISNHSAGKVEINSGTISSPKSRTVRNFYNDGNIVINGGVFEGQVWMQQGNATGSGDHSAKVASLTINGGEFSPAGADGSSVFLTNHSADNVKLVVNGGKFNTKIGCNDANKAGVKGSIVGGLFTESAKANTNSALFGEGVGFVQTADGLWTVEKLMEKVDENTFAVSTVEGLQWFAEQVNNGENYFEGKTIVLANDIDLNNVEWTPIGSATKDHGFMGNFDGNNKTIKNLKITTLTPDADGYVYAGLFGVTEGVDQKNSNFVKNLTIENVTIESEGHIAAAAIAYPYYTIVENITVKGDINIKGRDYVSGVLAYTRRCVEVKNLTIEGNARSVIEGNMTVGGVISDIQMNGGLTADYSNFKASGLTIKATKSVGGISGIIAAQTLNGATVENVEIVCDDARKGIVSGSLGGKSTITNISYNNVTGATAEVGADFDTGKPVEAKVGDVYYKTSFLDVLANAQAGETITMFVDVTASDIVVVNKAVTIDGNGHKLTSKATRAINVSGADGVVIKNLTVECSGERGVNVIQNATNVTLENVTMKAANYTVNAASSAPGAVIAVKNSTLTGLNVVNIAAPNANVTVDKTTLNCVDNNSNENYAALVLNKDAVNGVIAATNCTFNIDGESDKAKNGAEGGVITIDGKTDEVKIMVAAVEYGGNYYYACPTLASAIDKAVETDGVVTLIRDIELDAPVKVTKDVTLNLNGKTVNTGVWEEEGYGLNSYAFWVKGGTLTINGDGKVIAGDARYSMAVWAEGGDVVINGGVYEQLSWGDLIYASVGVVTINGGTFIPSNKNYNSNGTKNEFCALNCKDANFKNGKTNIVVKGGKFFKFDPANNKSETGHPSFLAEGYTSTQEGDYWVVK